MIVWAARSAALAPGAQWVGPATASAPASATRTSAASQPALGTQSSSVNAIRSHPSAAAAPRLRAAAGPSPSARTRRARDDGGHHGGHVVSGLRTIVDHDHELRRPDLRLEGPQASGQRVRSISRRHDHGHPRLV